MGTYSYENSLITQFKEQLQGDNTRICPDFYSHLIEPLNLNVEYLPGKAVLRNAYTEHTTQL